MNSVLEYIKEQDSPQKEICSNLRDFIFEIFPNIKEEMKWWVPTYGEEMYYIVALKDHVNIGFLINNFTKDEIDLLQGQWKTMRHLEINSLNEIDKEKIVKLLKIVKNKN